MSYTVTYTHTELLNDIDNSRDKKECCYIIVLSNVQAVLKKNRGKHRHIMLLISPISSYCYDLGKIISTEKVLMQ